MRLNALGLAAFGLQSVALAQNALGNVDRFLQSINIDPAAVSGRARVTGGTRLACSILELIDHTEVVSPSDGSLYTDVATANVYANARLHPGCIYTPGDVQGISKAVKVMDFLNVEFAVRSGGHSPLPGFASIDGGVLISTAGIKDLEYDPKTQTQRSGFGNLWGDVYGHLAPYNRIVVGGRVGTVGLGLAIGGGLSHFSNERGWACQNVVSYEVVLGNGSVVVASEKENADLFFSIKIGGNNFGIVTHLTQLTYPLGAIWGGSQALPSNYSEQFMAALADYQAGGQSDTKSAILPYLVLNGGQIIQQYSYLEPVEKPAAFQAFYDIPVLEDHTQIYDSFYDMEVAPSPAYPIATLPRWSWSATTLYLDKEAYVEVARIGQNYTSRFAGLKDAYLVLMAQPISLSMVEESRARGVDPMNVTAKPQLWLSVSVGWIDAALDQLMDELMLEVLAAIEAYTRSRGVYDPLVFQNDAFATQRPYQSYGADSLAKLQSAARKYDPRGVFQRLVPGGFKLQD